VRDGIEFEPHGRRGVGRAWREPAEAVAHVVRHAVSIDLAEPDEHVAVRIVRSVLEFDDRCAQYVEILGQRLTGEVRDVAAQRQAAVVPVSTLR
jgi:hypothetical protein